MDDEPLTSFPSLLNQSNAKPTFSFPHGMVLWLTGLSSAGKTTIAQEVYRRLVKANLRVEWLDGDHLRASICKDLGFTKEDRCENIRRIGFIAGLLAKHGVIVIVSAISPYRASRDELRELIPNFIEVYINAPLEICESRDIKGLYRRARNGEITHLTGIDDVYEEPIHPEVECQTNLETVAESVAKVLAYLQRRFGELDFR